MRKQIACLASILALSLMLRPAAQGQFTPIAQPDAWYISNTTLLPTPATFPALSVTDGSFTINLSAPADYDRVVPGDWSTWNSPPWVETPTPHVLYTGVTTLTMTFSNPVSIFGFEAEPDPFNIYNMSAVFYLGPNPVGTITLPVNGNAGARLFAARGTFFDSVVFSSQVDFAIARLRYGMDPGGPAAIPEAGTLASFGSMAGLGLLWIRRRFLA